MHRTIFKGSITTRLLFSFIGIVGALMLFAAPIQRVYAVDCSKQVQEKNTPLPPECYGQLDTAKAAGLKAEAGNAQQQLTTYVGRGIQIALSILGVVFLILIVYAGFMWLVSQGETAKVKAARDTITQGAIGLGIVLGAYAITNFVIDRLLTQ